MVIDYGLYGRLQLCALFPEPVDVVLNLRGPGLGQPYYLLGLEPGLGYDKLGFLARVGLQVVDHSLGGGDRLAQDILIGRVLAVALRDIPELFLKGHYIFGSFFERFSGHIAEVFDFLYRISLETLLDPVASYLQWSYFHMPPPVLSLKANSIMDGITAHWKKYMMKITMSGERSMPPI